MNHSKVKHYVSIFGIISLGIFGITYLMYSPEINPTVVLSVIAGIAGLGGYSLRSREELKN